MPLPIIETLAKIETRNTLMRAQEINSRARRQDATRRVLIEQEDYRTLIQGGINRRFHQNVTRTDIGRHITLVLNPLRKVADRVLQAYKRPPRRTLEGASDAINNDWRKLMEEAHWDTMAATISRWAWICNVAISVPVIRKTANGPKLDYDIILPDVAEVYVHENDPFGDPAAIAYTISDVSDRTDGKNPITAVVLDAFAWRYYDRNGNEILDRRVVHDLGVFPGTIWRLERPVTDWWLSTRGARAVDATISTGVIAATMGWVRKGQNRKQSVLFTADLSAFPDKQIFNNETPIEAQIAPTDAQFDVLDMITSSKEFQEEIQFHYHELAESYGIASEQVDFVTSPANAANTNSLAQAKQHAALAEVREAQIPWWTAAEADSAYKTALMLRGMGHPDAIDPAIVKESFRIDYKPLTYVDAPQARLDMYAKKIKLGIMSQVDAMMEENPSLTREEAMKRIERVLEDRTWLEGELASRNLSKDAENQTDNIAQLQGRLGGMSSGADPSPDGEGVDNE